MSIYAQEVFICALSAGNYDDDHIGRPQGMCVPTPTVCDRPPFSCRTTAMIMNGEKGKRKI